MKVMELRCPNCGAMVSRETMKCKYCGANLVLVQDKLTLRNTMSCPKCGTSNGEGSFLCVNCGEVLTENVQFLKEVQKRIRFDQKRTREELSNKIKGVLEQDEFIKYSHYFARHYFVITERRILMHQDTVFGKRFWEAPWDEIASISSPIPIFGGTKVIVTTFDGKEEKFEFLGIATRFSVEAKNGLNDHMLGKKDIRAQIYRLNL